MSDEEKTFWNKELIGKLTDPRNVGLYIFIVIVLAITWSSVKTVQTNYELQKKISGLKQQNNVLSLQNDNAGLRNQYLQTDQYLELAARQSLGLAAPGESVLLVPESVALKYVSKTGWSKPTDTATKSADSRSKVSKNLQDWRDFLLGRKASE